MNILIAHNFYQRPGGEDECVAAEVAMLEAHGHNVIDYRLHNDSTDGMNPFGLASRAIWSRAAFNPHSPDETAN